MALAGAMTLCFYGPNGLKELAVQNMAKARYFFGKLEAAGLKRLTSGPFFHEAAFKVPGGHKTLEKLEAQGVVLGVPLDRFGDKAWPDDAVLVCVTDVQSREALDCAAGCVKGVLG